MENYFDNLTDREKALIVQFAAIAANIANEVTPDDLNDTSRYSHWLGTNFYKYIKMTGTDPSYVADTIKNGLSFYNECEMLSENLDILSEELEELEEDL